MGLSAAPEPADDPMTQPRAAASEARGAALAREEPFLLQPIWWLGLPVALAVLIFGTALFTPWYWQWLEGERGVLEQLQLVSLILALGVAVRLVYLPQVRDRSWLRVWLALAVAGCVYTIGEEASYGQHIFGWTTPDTWSAINQQNETNLHNIDNWFNAKPRLLLELSAIFGGIVAPIAIHVRPSIRRHSAALILPTVVCLPSAALAEATIFVERLVKELGIDAVPFLGFHANEVQELYYYMFVLFYLLALGHKIRSEAR